MTLGTLVTIALILAGLKLLVWWVEPRIAFYPTPGVQDTPAMLRLPFVDVRIPTADGEALHAWWLAAPDPRAQVVFFHGNGGNLSNWLDVIAGIRQRGLSVLAVDYRGYGGSTGSPSERGVYRDADATVRLFADRLRSPGTPVIYWGRSLGAPVASHAATRLAPDALLLESPMSHGRSLLETNPILWLLSFLSSYHFATSRFVAEIDVPLLIVHGELDSLVPLASGKQVFAAARASKKTFTTIPGADHNDLHVVNPAMYWRAIDAFVESARAGSR
jgi:fermentation-respiration switch protein FrsA (DUF1100 family)